MSAGQNAAVVERLYNAFRERDGATMASCYHRDAQFRDPVFTLRGPRVGTMWKMLCARGADLRIEYGNITATEATAGAQWQAWYSFSQTGRQVHNVVQARFRFADNAIVEHIDNFDFWRWSRQALGPLGLLLGWSTLLRNKVRAQAAVALERFAPSGTD